MICQSFDIPFPTLDRFKLRKTRKAKVEVYLVVGPHVTLNISGLAWRNIKLYNKERKGKVTGF